MCKNKAKPCYLEKQTHFCTVLIYFTLCSKFYNKLSARHLFTYTCTSTKPTFYDFNYDTTKGKHKYAAEYYKNAIHDIAVWHTHNGVTKHLRLGEGNSKKSLNVYIVQPLIWILMRMALSMNTRHSLALEAEITQYWPYYCGFTSRRPEVYKKILHGDMSKTPHKWLQTNHPQIEFYR